MAPRRTDQHPDQGSLFDIAPLTLWETVDSAPTAPTVPLVAPDLPHCGGLPAYTPEQAAALVVASRAAAARDLVERRQRLYRELRTTAVVEIDQLFDATENLRHLDRAGALGKLLRNLPGLMMSEDNLRLVTEAVSYPSCDTWGTMTPEQRALHVIAAEMDPLDYPWLGEHTVEVDEPAAVALAKARLIAGIVEQRASTAARSETSRRQEQLLRDTALAAGYTADQAKGAISDPGQLPRGHFSRGERYIEDADGKRLGKADHVIRLLDGTLVLVEAKYSGSTVNSYKRLGHECENKVRRWKEHFGDRAEVVILFSGATDAERVLALQALGARFVFEHDLDAYAGWLTGTAPQPTV